ncbi:unnamed protein product [Clavelina lepadiformis]|uniref:Transposase n=1 Tax=Clavelina lepadiformis TaxID=159417 RepID=A0ABP0FRG2_CLALP
MEEELQEIIEQDVKEIATRVEHADVVATTRNFIKLFMKKKVAMTYSLTRLGYGRKKVKKSFVESKLYQLLLSVFQRAVHKHWPSIYWTESCFTSLAVETKMGEEMKDELPSRRVSSKTIEGWFIRSASICRPSFLFGLRIKNGLSASRQLRLGNNYHELQELTEPINDQSLDGIHLLRPRDEDSSIDAKESIPTTNTDIQGN